MTTILQPQSQRHPGLDADLSHYCATHRYDEDCMGNVAHCTSFCGLDLATVPFTDAPEQICVVCARMCDAKGWL